MVGFDIKKRIEELKNGFDPTNEILKSEFKGLKILFLLISWIFKWCRCFYNYCSYSYWY